MGNLRQSQTKNTQTPDQSLVSGSRKPTYHPVEELQGIIGNRALGNLIKSQQYKSGEVHRSQDPLLSSVSPVSGQPIQRMPMFRGLSHELMGHWQQGNPVQAKLTIGEAGDKYELEADRVASEVVDRINAPVSSLSTQHQSIQAQGQQDELMRKPMVQLKSIEGGMAATPELESSIQQAKGSGMPIAQSIRKPMEQSFGADFSGVRVHADAQSDQLNQSIQARAFTTGKDIFFRQGEYNPGSQEGKKLIAHELTHVVQQGGGKVVTNQSVRVSAAPVARIQCMSLMQFQDKYELKTVQQQGQNPPRTSYVHHKLVGHRPNQPYPQFNYGYVANVPTYPGGTTPNAIATKYEEGFEDKTEMSYRFRLVVGVNKYKSLMRARSEDEIRDVINNTGNFNYPGIVFGFTWEPFWVKKSTNQKADSNQIETDFGTLNTQEQDQAEATLKEANYLPYGVFRDEITKSQYTQRCVNDLKNRFNIPNIYIHIGDADALSLKVPEEQSRHGHYQPMGLFSKYDQLLTRHQTKGRQLPYLASGGYELRQGAQGGDLPADDDLSVLANKIDMKVRRIISKVDPRAPYFPEPNTLIKYEALLKNPTDPNSGLKNRLFGIKGGEGRELMKNVLGGLRGDLKEYAFFKPKAAIATSTAGGGERLKARPLPNYNPHEKQLILRRNIPPNILRSALRKVLTSAQSHAHPRGWITQVGMGLGLDWYGVQQIYQQQVNNSGNAEIRKVLNDLLPNFHQGRPRRITNAQRGLVERMAQSTITAIESFLAELEQIIIKKAQ
ncbi:MULTISPECIES: DUF4157 domain-containing protein [unclassified Moorena]|uniref:eCIS core domain-containing protein n=1 Tax=unclassified Moorena TaxID=2683338 RepID=UPI0013BA2F3D|nr:MULTISPECIES: DUF4157 domain-containing protein [unclassified Moorena]NEP35855.1 DUF4157 domain-containing protein [Moorena sp. SIO3B2]NER88504.1 DUF4157 domain-containing protein [Moorena sp. SIO3A2]